MWKKTLLFLMLLLGFFVLCSCNSEEDFITGADASAIIEKDYAEPEQDPYVYTGNGSDWKSELFEKPSTQYSDSLALVAAKISEGTENEEGNNESIKNLFSEYGLYACKYKYFDGNGIFSEGGAFAIGQDTLTVNGTNTTILVIAARGTINVQEAIGDYFHGGENDFLGMKVYHNVYDFEEKIWKGIDEYITEYPAIKSTENLKILITGHSLGGAAANLVGARFTDGIGDSEWWSDKVLQEDIYVYTYGAIKALATDENISDGYENIHNIYNKYDSFGPYGNLGSLRVSSPNAKFGHTDMFDDIKEEEGTLEITTANHNMPTYIDALEKGFVSCSKDNLSAAEITTNVTEEKDSDYQYAGSVDFSIEGKWKSVGEYGFGQAQPGAIVAFDGVNCNFYSPSDTYAFYQENGIWRLDCTDFLFAETVCFTVEIIDNDNIHIYYGSSVTELKRVAEGISSEEHQYVDLDDFYIEGKWKNIGDDGFGQAQPGAIVAFDGTHCNYYSPYDTYAFYYDGSNYRLEVVGLLGDTCSFTVNIIDNDNIEVIDGYGAVSLMRIE